MRIEAGGVVTSWSYDKTYQLTRERRTGHFGYDVAYEYDPVGNRLSMNDGSEVTTYAYDAANQLMSLNPNFYAVAEPELLRT